MGASAELFLQMQDEQTQEENEENKIKIQS